jgi:hypothetical protein
MMRLIGKPCISQIRTGWSGRFNSRACWNAAARGEISRTPPSTSPSALTGSSTTGVLALARMAVRSSTTLPGRQDRNEPLSRLTTPSQTGTVGGSTMCRSSRAASGASVVKLGRKVSARTSPERTPPPRMSDLSRSPNQIFCSRSMCAACPSRVPSA